MMKKLFFICWGLAFLYAIYVLIGGKIMSVGRLFIYEDRSAEVYPGDLYKMCKIDKFRQTRDYNGPDQASYTLDINGRYEYRVIEHEESFGDNLKNIEAADILIFGDSFFAGIRGLEIYPSLNPNADTLRAVNASYYGSAEAGENPLAFFERIKYERGERKILLLETVERYSLDRALHYKNYQRLIDSEFLRDVVKHIFVNDHLEYFFTDNIISYPIVKGIANIKFKYFDDIDTRIGDYSENPDMLFYFQEVDFNRQAKTEKELNQAADNIVFLANQLDKGYNIELIFVIVPNKYSIYGEFAERDFKYDNYIPGINSRLAKQGINFIDLYVKYIDYRKNDDSRLLYPPSETHYSGLGRKILTDEIVSKILDISQQSKP